MHHHTHLKRPCSSKTGVQPGTPRPNSENFQIEAKRSNKESDVATRKHKHESISLSENHTKQISTSTPSSSENLPDFLIWVKNEPFDFGILSPFPSAKIGINILRKVADYCREKPGHYPLISLNQWSHICKYKIQLATELAFAYFRVFDVFTRSWSTDQPHPNSHSVTTEKSQRHSKIHEVPEDFEDNRDIKFYRAQKHGIDTLDEFSADTLQFLLFLYIQHFLRLHKKYLNKSYAKDEPWPKPTLWIQNGNRSKSPQSANPRSGGSVPPEQQHAEFLIANVGDMISFLQRIGRSKKDEDAADECRVSVDIVRALSLILGAASTTLDREFRTLDECLLVEDISHQLDYNPSKRNVSKQRFISWIVGNLKINPWGPSSIPIPQVPIPVMTGVWEEAECYKQNRIYWNTQSYPKSWFLISGVHKQVLHLDSIETMSSVKVHRCIDSQIYIPGVYNMVLIQKCHRVVLNIGVAVKCIKIMECSDITVSGVGRQFIICDVVESNFHLLTPSAPIICGSKNRHIQLSPYDTSYPSLHIHMNIADISTKVQRWSKPLEMEADRFSQDKSQQSNYSLIRPEQFKVKMFPFKTCGSGSGTPIQGILQSAYQRKVENMTETVMKVKKEFAARMVSDEDANLMYQITTQRFKKWLKETGNYEQIVALRSFQKSVEQKSIMPLLCSKGHDLSCITRSVRSFFNSASFGESRGKVITEDAKKKDLDHEPMRKSYRSSGRVVFTPSPSTINYSGAGGEGEKLDGCITPNSKQRQYSSFVVNSA